jgi:AcrR family transcriptional regulator
LRLKALRGASLNRILEQAGISKGSAYYYFDDKADVFLTVVQRYLLEIAESIEALNLTS